MNDATPQAGAASPTISGSLESGVARIDALPQELGNLPLFQHFDAVMPAADLFFGGTILILVILLHAAGVRSVTTRVSRWTKRILKRPRLWQADLLMSCTVFLLLFLHLTEIFGWSAALVYAGLVADWRAAGFFAGNTYTTLGYGAFVLPPRWEMVATLIAISGLFTFGWSGSVLVDLVGRCQKIKDAANAGTSDEIAVPRATPDS